MNFLRIGDIFISFDNIANFFAKFDDETGMAGVVIEAKRGRSFLVHQDAPLDAYKALTAWLEADMPLPESIDSPNDAFSVLKWYADQS